MCLNRGDTSTSWEQFGNDKRNTMTDTHNKTPKNEKPLHLVYVTVNGSSDMFIFKNKTAKNEFIEFMDAYKRFYGHNTEISYIQSV